MKDLLDQYAAYDRWANMRFVERLSAEPDAVLDIPLLSSFPSLRETLLHIRDAEATWTARLQGKASAWPADDDRSLGSVLRFTDVLCELVLGYDDADLMCPVVYRDLHEISHEQARWQMLLHCFNHSTQHRGQLITMMRELELDDIPVNDIVVYQRSLNP